MICEKTRLKRACGGGAKRGDDVEGPPAVRRANRLAADGEAERDQPLDRFVRGLVFIRRGETAGAEIHQRFREERVVIGRAMADLHRLPHRLGNARPRRIDQRRGRRIGDKGAGEIEKKRRILVSARVETAQRRQEIASAQIRIADQVERRIAWNKAVPLIGREQVAGAGADDGVDLGNGSHPGWRFDPLGLWMLLASCIEQRRHRSADRGPVRLVLVAGRRNGVAQRRKARLLAQLRLAGASQNQPQDRIGQGGLIELPQVGIPGARSQQQRIANVVKRWAHFRRRQHPVCRAGSVTQVHRLAALARFGIGVAVPQIRLAGRRKAGAMQRVIGHQGLCPN